jgi:hypothetical protein
VEILPGLSMSSTFIDVRFLAPENIDSSLKLLVNGAAACLNYLDNGGLP